MTAPLSILHVDMDAFYASVEMRDDATLAGRPVAVGGSSSGRGVIAAASYEARAFGVHSAMPTAQAEALCPELVLLPPDFEKYTAESRRIMALFRAYTPLVEALSLDEAFLDVSGCERLFGDAVEIGRAIKRDILRELGLVASVGVASSKFVAKLASDLDKPDGFRVIRAEEQREVLDPLSVSKIFGVGPRTAKRLESMGVHTIGDLSRRPREEVAREFGATGAWIHDLAHGIDPRRVTPRRDEKSVSHERTFPQDVEDRDELRLRLLEFCEELAFRLRDQGLRGRTVALKARYWNFKTVTRTRTLSFPTNLGPRLYAVARELLARVPPGPLRLLGVQVSGLEDVRAPMQGQLWSTDVAPGWEPPPGGPGQPGGRGQPEGPGQSGGRGRPEGSGAAGAGGTGADPARLARATAGMDRLRRKYGRGAVVPASLLGRERVAGRDGSEGTARLE